MEKMNSNIYERKEYILSFFAVVSLYFFGIFPQMAGNNSTYAVEQINNYNPEIFANNISGGDGSMSPRFFLSALMKLVMTHNGGDWTSACLFFVFLGAVILAFATVNIAFNVTEKNRLFITGLMAYLIWTSVNANFIKWNTFDISTIGMGTAIATVMLAFSFVVGENKRWNIAWLILALACLLHVHEGMYGFCLLFIVFASEAVEKKSLGFGKKHALFLVYLIALFICVIPGLFGEGSGLTNAEFVEIYAKIRSPFHLDPEYWEKADILKYVLCILGTGCFRILSLYFVKKEKIKSFLVEFGITIVAILAVFIIQEIFVNIVPVAALVTMYIPKFFKYAGFLSQIWAIKTLVDWLEVDDYVVASMSYITVVLASSQGFMRTIVIYAGSMLGLFFWKKFNIKFIKYAYPIAFLGGIVVGPVLGKKLYVLLVLAIIFISIWNKYPFFKKVVFNWAVIGVLSMGLLLAGSKGRIWKLDNGQVTGVDPEEYLVNIMGEELYDFAMDFRNSTSTDVTFMNDFNYGYTHWFQLVSQRNTYASTKIIPSVASHIGEWWSRGEATSDLFEKSDAEIVDLMQENDIEFLFVDGKNYETVEKSSMFCLYSESTNDKYRIYTLVEK